MNKCFGYWAECPNQVPDGVSPEGDVLYWKIDCPKRDECFLDWKNVGGRLGYFDIKLLEEGKNAV
jgi:hypothetical protein